MESTESSFSSTKYAATEEKEIELVSAIPINRDLVDLDESTTQKVHALLKKQGLLDSKIPTSTIDNTPSEELTKKISLWTQLKESGTNFNQRLLNTHQFRNPLIMSKMLGFFDLDPNGSNFNQRLFDLANINKLPNHEELLDRAVNPRAKSIPKNHGEAKQGLASNFTSSKISSSKKGWGSRRRRI